MHSKALDRVYVPLRLCYGVVPIVAGADKFTNLLTDWSKYLPDAATAVVPVSPGVFMMAVGVVEIVAGLAVLTVLPRLGAYVVAAWLVLVAVAVLLAGYYDIAVRDLVMALGAYTLGAIAALRGEGILPGGRPAGAALATAEAR
ncbi:MAG TPA: DoxX family membrane protein [Phycisphaerales bacterium]|nr:DoxX family membrane protein [Phycisphaerales bacterium]